MAEGWWGGTVAGLSNGARQRGRSSGVSGDAAMMAEERRFAELPRDAVRRMAEGAGAELSEEGAALLAEDVCYRLREAAQVRREGVCGGPWRSLRVCEGLWGSMGSCGVLWGALGCLWGLWVGLRGLWWGLWCLWGGVWGTVR